jgi:beta-galactosidase
MMAPVDVITEEKDFSKYPFLIAPSYQLIDKNLIDRFTKYVNDGGTLILTCRSGQKDRRGHIWQTLWAEPIYDLIGAAIPRYDVLPPGRNGHVSAGMKTYEWGSWADIVEPRQGTETLATYTDQFYKGSAAAVRHHIGKGTVIYIGADSLNGDLEADLLWSAYNAAGAKPARLPINLFIDWRDGFWVANNFTDSSQIIPAAPGVKMLSGARSVPPGGTAIWQ